MTRLLALVLLSLASLALGGCGAVAHADEPPFASVEVDCDSAAPIPAPFKAPGLVRYASVAVPGRSSIDLQRATAATCYGDELAFAGVQCWTSPVGVADGRLVVVCPKDLPARVRFVVPR